MRFPWPWNPAILEQRIARIHRIGQKRPVQIVNFVSKGTIEEGMLSVLAFKRSLSAGILDGGSGEISLGGSRLSRFMKDVENVTGNIGEGEAVTPAEEVATAAAPTLPPAAAAAPMPDPWAALAQLGQQFVAALASANAPQASSHPWVERDPVTGVQNLKMPMPPPETARHIANALSALADSLRGGAA